MNARDRWSSCVRAHLRCSTPPSKARSRAHDCAYEVVVRSRAFPSGTHQGVRPLLARAHRAPRTCARTSRLRRREPDRLLCRSSVSRLCASSSSSSAASLLLILHLLRRLLRLSPGSWMEAGSPGDAGHAQTPLAVGSARLGSARLLPGAAFVSGGSRSRVASAGGVCV